MMRTLAVGFVSALLFAAVGHAQEIQEVPASKSGVVLPEDIFALPPGQWFVARQVSQGSEPCLPQACEAGFNSGALVISVEHANEHVRVIAGFRDCANVAFQEVETGLRPGKYVRSKVWDAVKDVVKGAEKSCKAKAPGVPQLDIASLFPRDSS